MAKEVQLLVTRQGFPVEFAFLPGCANDTRGLHALPFNLPTTLTATYSQLGLIEKFCIINSYAASFIVRNASLRLFVSCNRQAKIDFVGDNTLEEVLEVEA